MSCPAPKLIDLEQRKKVFWLNFDCFDGLVVLALFFATMIDMFASSKFTSVVLQATFLNYNLFAKNQFELYMKFESKVHYKLILNLLNDVSQQQNLSIGNFMDKGNFSWKLIGENQLLVDDPNMFRDYMKFNINFKAELQKNLQKPDFNYLSSLSFREKYNHKIKDNGGEIRFNQATNKKTTQRLEQINENRDISQQICYCFLIMTFDGPLNYNKDLDIIKTIIKYFTNGVLPHDPQIYMAIEKYNEQFDVEDELIQVVKEDPIDQYLFKIYRNVDQKEQLRKLAIKQYKCLEKKYITSEKDLIGGFLNGKYLSADDQVIFKEVSQQLTDIEFDKIMHRFNLSKLVCKEVDIVTSVQTNPFYYRLKGLVELTYLRNPKCKQFTLQIVERIRKYNWDEYTDKDVELCNLLLQQLRDNDTHSKQKLQVPIQVQEVLKQEQIELEVDKENINPNVPNVPDDDKTMSYKIGNNQQQCNSIMETESIQPPFVKKKQQQQQPNQSEVIVDKRPIQYKRYFYFQQRLRSWFKQTPVTLKQLEPIKDHINDFRKYKSIAQYQSINIIDQELQLQAQQWHKGQMEIARLLQQKLNIYFSLDKYQSFSMWRKLISHIQSKFTQLCQQAYIFDGQQYRSSQLHKCDPKYIVQCFDRFMKIILLYSGPFSLNIQQDAFYYITWDKIQKIQNTFNGFRKYEDYDAFKQDLQINIINFNLKKKQQLKQYYRARYLIKQKQKGNDIILKQTQRIFKEKQAIQKKNLFFLIRNTLDSINRQLEYIKYKSLYGKITCSAADILLMEWRSNFLKVMQKTIFQKLAIISTIKYIDDWTVQLSFLISQLDEIETDLVEKLRQQIMQFNSCQYRTVALHSKYISVKELGNCQAFDCYCPKPLVPSKMICLPQ